MQRQCPRCRKAADFTVASCANCQMVFYKTPAAPKDFTDICIRIAGAVLIAAVGAIVAMVLHPWS